MLDLISGVMVDLKITLAMTIDCLKVKNIPMSRFPTNPKSESCSVLDDAIAP